MPLIKSISGFRGTLGGRAGENLTAQDIVESVAAFGAMLRQRSDSKKVVIGRDGRPSGPVVSQLATATLQMLGLDVIDLGYATTPTVEMAVPRLEAAGAGGSRRRLPTDGRRRAGVHGAALRRKRRHAERTAADFG